MFLGLGVDGNSHTDRALVCDDENILEMDGDDGYRTM